MKNPILSDKKNFVLFSQPPHIKSVDESEEDFQFCEYGCLRKVDLISNGKQVLWAVKKVLQCHFSDLYNRMNALTDKRERKCYSAAELVLGGIVLFLLKKKSRHAMDQSYGEQDFIRNYRKIFKLRCPSMSAVEDFYRLMSAEEFDGLKASLIATLIEKRTLHSHRLFGKYFTIAVDATGVHSSQRHHWNECTHQTSKNDIYYARF